MKVLLSFLFPFITNAQLAVDLATNKNVTLELSQQYLFIQENCEACENALNILSACDDSIKKSISIVAMESQTWAHKIYKSDRIKKIQPRNFYLMKYVEANKMKVYGTPTYWPNTDQKLRARTCEQLKKEMKI